MLANLPQNVRNPASRNQKIAQAVGQHESDKKQRLFERAFAFAFRGLVYAQIWEDPVVDMEALDIQSDSHVITIASGGCNVLSYLVADPAKIIAVDLNTAHIALNKLKCEAVRQLPDHDQLHAFFAEADRADNIARYREYIQAVLDDTTRRYWEGRDFSGRRRIGGFEKGLYRRGLLGGFIGIAHLLAKIYRVDPVKILAANSLDEQRAIFDTQMAPIFDRKFVRWLTDQPPSLFGLGIPPAQFDALAGSEKMADVLRKRLEKLACGFDLKDNYFAWQAFGRGYGKQPEAPLPPYLQKANYEAVKSRVDRIEVDHANFIERLAASADKSLDRYILLDAQDWMNDAQLNALWAQITRTAKPGARVLFRTAAEPSLLPGRVIDDVLSRWEYRDEQSAQFTANDRSSIYGGVHLYVLRHD